MKKVKLNEHKPKKPNTKKRRRKRDVAKGKKDR
jgi:hypothetical protein